MKHYIFVNRQKGAGIIKNGLFPDKGVDFILAFSSRTIPGYNLGEYMTNTVDVNGMYSVISIDTERLVKDRDIRVESIIDSYEYNQSIGGTTQVQRNAITEVSCIIDTHYIDPSYLRLEDIVKISPERFNHYKAQPEFLVMSALGYMN